MNTYEHEEILNQNGEPTDIVPSENFAATMSFLNPDDIPDLDKAELGFNIQPESIEFKNVGDSVRAIFNGFTFFNVKDKLNKGSYIPKETAVLQTKNGIKINMGANLIKQLKLIPVGTAVQITYKGETRTNSGNDVKVYEVITLNVPRANIPVPVQSAAPQLTQPKPVEPTKVENIEQETGEVKPPVRLVSPMDYDPVVYAAHAWNIEAGQAARQIAKKFAGVKSISFDEFKQIVDEGLELA